MNKTINLRSGILAFSLLAVSGFVTAADDVAGVSQHGAKHERQHHFDPVAHMQRDLDNLSKKLALQDTQKEAWRAYADSALNRTKDRASKMQEMRGQRHRESANEDTAARLDRMSQVMRERADELGKIAQDTRSLQSVLTPEQKTILDLYWKAQFRRGTMHHRAAA
jgi:Skp family chaperone for outer membrane proteins